MNGVWDLAARCALKWCVRVARLAGLVQVSAALVASLCSREAGGLSISLLFPFSLSRIKGFNQ